MKKVLLFVWQLPQHLLGLALIKATGAELMRATTAIPVDIWKYDEPFITNNWFTRHISGVSLGQYIVLPIRAVNWNTALHEHGHSRQSELLGPLYLLIIGIYSALFCNLWDRWFHNALTDDNPLIDYFPYEFCIGVNYKPAADALIFLSEKLQKKIKDDYLKIDSSGGFVGGEEVPICDFKKKVPIKIAIEEPIIEQGEDIA